MRAVGEPLASSVEASSATSSDEECSSSDIEEKIRVCEEIERQKRELVMDAANDPDFIQGLFVVKVRGGTWTNKNVHKPVDGVRGGCESELARTFCKKCGFHKSLTLAYGRYKNRPMCFLICREWCARMQFLIKIWFDDQSHGPDFSAELTEYVELARFQAFAAAEPATSFFGKAIAKVRRVGISVDDADSEDSASDSDA